MSIWDRIIKFDEDFEKRVETNWENYTKPVKKAFNYKPLKIAAGVVSVAGVVGLMFTAWALLLLIFGVAVILGLAAKS